MRGEGSVAFRSLQNPVTFKCANMTKVPENRAKSRRGLASQILLYLYNIKEQLMGYGARFLHPSRHFFYVKLMLHHRLRRFGMFQVLSGFHVTVKMKFCLRNPECWLPTRK